MLSYRYLSLLCLLVCLSAPSITLADAREDFLLRILATSTQPHTRAQAIRSLAAGEPTQASIKALVSSSYEESLEVRTVSIEVLTKFKTEHPDLFKSMYYIEVKAPRSKTRLTAGVNYKKVHDDLITQVSQLPGAIVLREGWGAQGFTLETYHMGTSVVELTVLPDGSVNAQVTVLIQRGSEKRTKALLSGGATATGGSDDTRAELAIQGAFTSALSRLGRVMETTLKPKSDTYSKTP